MRLAGLVQTILLGNHANAQKGNYSYFFDYILY